MRRTATRIAAFLSICSGLAGCTANLPIVEFDITATPAGAEVDIAGCLVNEGLSTADCLGKARQPALNPGESSIRAGWDPNTPLTANPAQVIVNQFDKSGTLPCLCQAVILNYGTTTRTSPYVITIASGSTLSISCQGAGDCVQKGDCSMQNVCH